MLSHETISAYMWISYGSFIVYAIMFLYKFTHHLCVLEQFIFITLFLLLQQLCQLFFTFLQSILFCSHKNNYKIIYIYLLFVQSFEYYGYCQLRHDIKKIYFQSFYFIFILHLLGPLNVYCLVCHWIGIHFGTSC